MNSAAGMLNDADSCKRNFAVYGGLLLCLVGVHFVIDATQAARSASQAAVFTWTGLGMRGYRVSPGLKVAEGAEPIR